ncbi:MAG: ferredoxin reductase [Oleiphilaceae bacterium]|nr:ferredoxin reductase [Oleiphilaceae bacterium]
MTAQPTPLKTALHWLGRQVSNHSNPMAYLDPLLGSIDPMLVRGSVAAKVVSIEEAARDTKTFVFRPAGHWSGFKPGQHLSLTVEIHGVRHTRTFSVSSPPDRWKQDREITLTIKRFPGGLVTHWMHDHLREGDILHLGDAFGDFLLPANPRPLLYIAGGSGITPILSQLATLGDSDYPKPVTLLYYVRTEADLVGARLLWDLEGRWRRFNLVVHTTDDGELLCRDHLPEDLSGHECYLCGPRGLMDLSAELLGQAGVPEEQQHSTFFSAPQVALESDELGGTVSFTRSGVEASGDGETSLLEMAEGAGLKPKHGCRMGVCHQCACTKKEGIVVSRLTGKSSLPGEETIQLCVTVPKGPVQIDI